MKAGWTEVASLSCNAKENTLERIPLSDTTRDFQINGSTASMYFEESDANKRFFITKMFIIS